MFTFSLVVLIPVLILLFLNATLFSFEEYGWSIVVTIVTLIGGWVFLEPVREFIHANDWITLIKYLGAYIGVGFIMAVVKWFFFNLKHVATIKEHRKIFEDGLANGGKIRLQANGEYLELNPENKRRGFVDYYRQNGPRKTKVYDADYSKENSLVDALTPKAKDNLGYIALWIFQWPFVLINTVFSEMLIKLVRRVGSFLDALFSRVARKLVANATKGL